MGTRWRGMLAPLGIPTGDGRRFLASGISHRELPLALKWQRVDEMGHDTSVVVGSVETIEIAEDAVWAEGEFFDDLDPSVFERLLGDVAEAMLLTGKKVIGPSVDAGEVEIVMAKAGSDEPLTEEDLDDLYYEAIKTGTEPDIEMLFTKYQIAAATLVTVPAFQQCRPFELMYEEAALTAAVRSTGWDSFPLAERDMAWSGAEAEKRIADDAGIGGDTPDWTRYAESFLYTDEEANPETKGAYGFQIVDVVDGSRMIVPRAVFTVAGVLSGARGGTNITDQDQQSMREVIGALYQRMAEQFDDDTIVPPWDMACGDKKKKQAALLEALTASSPTYDPALFEAPADPMPGLIPIRVTPDGRVFGHIATHDVCHVGMPGVCTTAPVDTDGYAQFHRYPLMGNNGEFLLTGRITYAGGESTASCACCRGNDDHACGKLSMGGAISHHDHMTTVAYVRATEDTVNNAIRVDGVLAPGATDEAVKALSRGRVSGDWRSAGAGLRLVEVLTLHRERPGFPLPRVRVSAGFTMALVAAGTVGEQPLQSGVELDYERLAGMIADRLSSLVPAVGPGQPEPMDDLSGDAGVIVGEIAQVLGTAASIEARRTLGEIVEVSSHVLR